MNSAKLLPRHPLNNGLTLEFWDYSRRIIYLVVKRHCLLLQNSINGLSILGVPIGVL